MKKCLFILNFFIIFFFSNYCFAAKKPLWIENTNKECPKNGICATGNGSSPNMAKTDARNNILKYFETSINSKFTSSLSANDNSVKNFSSEDNEELSSGILKGVEIQNTFDDGKIYYAFAVLNKEIAIKEIGNDIDKIDSKMKLLISEKNTKYNREIEKLYLKRENLNKKYLILTGNMKPEIVKYEEIFASKKIAGETSLTFYVEPSEGYEQQVNDYLSSVLINYGAKITSNKKDANRILIITVNKSNLHLNINGFIKQMYVLKIENNTPQGEVLSSLYQEFTEVGRSENQIRELVNMNIKDYINENIQELF